MRLRTAVYGLAAMLPGTIAAQTKLTLDLGEPAGGTTTVTPGLYAVSIINRLPKAQYNVSVLVRTVPIKALQIVALNAAPPVCSALAGAVTAISEAETKKDEKALKTAVSRAYKAIESEGAKPGCEGDANGLENYIAETILDWPYTVIVGQGQEVDVTVARIEDGAEVRTWKRVFTTGAVGEWRVTYGFAAHFDAWGPARGPFARRQSYYSAPTGSKFLVSDREDRGGVDLTPAILYHFMPARDELKARNRGWTAGIGTDLKNPIVIAGYSWTYWQNLNFQVGLLARRERQLLPKYAVGDTIASDLSFDQLTEPTVRIRPQVAVTLRFGSNPFASQKPKEPAKEGPEKPDAKQEPAPQ